ncbi:MAG: hypothetical protein HOL29_06180 [Euryarchaeota archaeon]|jgi:hypothetical protein|nr:hypothetical protein [Euryarchaeota archaeon]
MRKARGGSDFQAKKNGKNGQNNLVGTLMQCKNVLIVLLITAAMIVPSLHVNSLTELEQSNLPAHAGTTDRVVVDGSPQDVSADEVIQFEAIIYDAVNTVIVGDVNWSVSNGTISEDGWFYPWSSGTVEITAEHEGVEGSINITVTPGVATSIEVTSTQFLAKEASPLTADLIDGRGNRMAGNEGMVWDLNGMYFGQGTPIFTPETTSPFELKVRFNQLEDSATATVTAGSPHEFVFSQNLQVRAGSITLIQPTLVDQNGYEMPLSFTPSIGWYAENGSFNAQGEYSATNTGRWAISATSGNITGNGFIDVIPGDAVASELKFVNDPETFVAGERYEVVFDRRDENGYIGFVTPEIGSLSTDSGGLSTDDGHVYWSPSEVGTATLTGTDGTVSTQLVVEVVHGQAIELVMMVEPAVAFAGDQVAIVLNALDVKGNTWVVNGTINMNMGNASQISDMGTYQLIQATTIQSWYFEGNWFDNETGSMFVATYGFDVQPGRLAFIMLPGDGEQVPADGEIDLSPQFYDAYGNQLTDIESNWTIDDSDITLEMILNSNRWVPTSVGGHEIRVNADGVFATIRITVTAGTAHGLVTDMDSGLLVKAGEPTDLFVQVVDIHGNLAEATSVTTPLNSSLGELEASPTGLGFWQFTGKESGTYELILQEEDALHVIPLTVVAGEPIRIQASLNRETMAEGDVVLLEAFGIDEFGNIVAIEGENTSIDCNAGSAKFVTEGTWELSLNDGGTDRTCTLRWNGLLAQTFFDVDEVLLGGAVGSTNTAMSMAALLLCLILAVLVVLARKASSAEGKDWVDDAFDEGEDDEDEEYEEELSKSSDAEDNTPLPERHGLSPEGIAQLAKEAGAVGVMQATPSTEQGQTGWYVDVSEELQYWEVTPEGEWIRHE